MEPILSEKAKQARYQNASVGNVYPADERFAEIIRNAGIRDVLKLTEVTFPIASKLGITMAEAGERITALTRLNSIVNNMTPDAIKTMWFDGYDDCSESVGIAADIIGHGPGVNCEPGVACVPFDYNRHVGCRYCNQVVA